LLPAAHCWLPEKCLLRVCWPPWWGGGDGSEGVSAALLDGFIGGPPPAPAPALSVSVNKEQVWLF